MINYSNLVVFDLDGVLMRSKTIHKEALNEAILNVAGEEYIITDNEHTSRYDGRSTKVKLEMLHQEKGLPYIFFNDIEKMKKIITADLLEEEIKPNQKLIRLFEWLKCNDYKIAVASNAIRQTIVTCLINLGIMKMVDYFQSNEDVKYPKPHPEMYWNCMVAMGADPSTTLIVEDSAIGRIGAKKTGANLMLVNSPEDVTLENIQKHLNFKPKQTTWDDSEMVVLIPMAGAGSRFAEVGYTFPKPLIEVKGKPMIQVVVENLGIKAKYVFIVQEAHYEKYNLKTFLNLIAPGCEIVQVNGLTEGAACTTLLAKEFINNNKRLVIANSDQFIEWEPNETLYSLIESGADGGILTFNSCFGYNTLIDTKEFGKIPIGKIVNQKLDCNVKSYNEITKQFEYCKINDWIRLPGNNLNWKTLKTNWGGITKVTSDHEFLTINGWQRIDNLNNDLMTTFPKMNTFQYDVFCGTMLGDGSISYSDKRNCVNSGLKFAHSTKQLGWAKTKLNIFNNLGINYYISKIGKYEAIFSRVNINEEFKQKREMWYPNGKKIFPENIVLNALSIATWYMDDGTLIKQKTPVARFATDGFDHDSILRLQNQLMDLNIETYTTKNGNRERICVKASSSKYFFDLIFPYIIPEMEYKLPKQYHGKTSYGIWQSSQVNDNYYHHSISIEDLIEEKSDTKYAFCLTTKNGNFIVDNLVAHNCHPKWSYAALDEDGFVSEVAEKNPISDHATVGVYYWAKGSDYVKYAERMIEKNVRVKNEFYVCPVFNQAIEDGKKIVTRDVRKMWGIGDPDSLNTFLIDYKGEV